MMIRNGPWRLSAAIRAPGLPTRGNGATAVGGVTGDLIAISRAIAREIAIKSDWPARRGVERPGAAGTLVHCLGARERRASVPGHPADSTNGARP